ncbi:porin family protein [Allomuricauda sp. SCSIO 65647]|uniref:porin family protein n=1 Tax=Allomuricauda sp. SCSIO 65647 TaxID=2908843 RepID=UPI001F2A84B1|nr:porin family protein [Muricauda sp. SCSIO 65647]UJH68276.1 porin family protein [Muricauda sp. SCSIO 65647]
MNKLNPVIFFVLFLTMSISGYSQITFEKGYFIKNSGEKVECLIKNQDWKNNPIRFDYKLYEGDHVKIETIQNVKEFRINNTLKYVRHKAKIDRSSGSVNTMSEDSRPIFSEEEVFLKILVEGKSSLYQYTEGNLFRYFFDTEEVAITPLVFKRYKTRHYQTKGYESKSFRVAQNDAYKRQLWNNLKCEELSKKRFEKLKYTKDDLINIFIAYNQCVDPTYIGTEQKQKRDLFNLTLRPRLNISSPSTPDPVIASRNINFDDNQSFGFGLEVEYILPFNKNKWGIIAEPTYQYYSAEKDVENSSISGGRIITTFDYSSIEVPVGIRHYIFLNDSSKLFINVGYTFDFTLDNFVEFRRADNSILDSFEFLTGENLAYGVGFKFKNRYSAEFRYQSSRDIRFSGSAYESMSFILGYTVF